MSKGTKNWHSSKFGQATCPKTIWEVHLWGLKHHMTTTTTIQQHNNHDFKCLYFMFANHHICVILQSSVHHIGSWNCPKFELKSKCTEILVKGDIIEYWYCTSMCRNNITQLLGCVMWDHVLGEHHSPLTKDSQFMGSTFDVYQRIFNKKLYFIIIILTTTSFEIVHHLAA